MPAVRTAGSQQEAQATDNFLISEPTQAETSTDVPVTVTRTTLDTSTPSDDATMQDTIVSPDTDSLNSRNISPEHMQKSTGVKLEARGSCTNSIISTDSIVSETLDSRSYTVRNSESEIGKWTLVDAIDTARAPLRRCVILNY